MSRWKKWARLVTLLLFLAGCTPPTVGPTNGPGSPPVLLPATVVQPRDQYEVDIQGNAFLPPTVTLYTGDTVRWFNLDSITHTVTAGTPGQPSGLFDFTLSPGDSYSFDFEQTGTYDYYCRDHPEERGQAVVQPGVASATASTAAALPLP